MAMDLPNRRRLGVGALTLLTLGALAPEVSCAQTRQPTFVCANTGALRVTCQGSFLDGTSAAGVTVRVLDNRDRVVYVGTVDPQGRISFRKPDAEFHIVFDAGQGSVLTILASEMT
jgi:hypothetical protein